LKIHCQQVVSIRVDSCGKGMLYYVDCCIQAYETGNRYHLLHSVALLCVPLTRKPRLVCISQLIHICMIIIASFVRSVDWQ